MTQSFADAAFEPLLGYREYPPDEWVARYPAFLDRKDVARFIQLA